MRNQIKDSPGIRSTTSHRRRHHRGSRSPDRKSYSRGKSASREEPADYVYRAYEGKERSARVVAAVIRRLGRDGESKEEEEEGVAYSEPMNEKRRIRNRPKSIVGAAGGRDARRHFTLGPFPRKDDLKSNYPLPLIACSECPGKDDHN